MLNRINAEIEFNKKKLARKEKALEEYQTIIENGITMTTIEAERRGVLLAEISLINIFIDGLNYIKEGQK